MNYVLVSVKDELSGYGAIDIQYNDDVAKRAFANACRSIEQFRSNPADYSLYRIGNFDSVSGEIVPCNVKLISASSVVQEVENEAD